MSQLSYTQVHGGDVYTNAYRCDFSANINPLGMPAGVREAIRNSADASLHYPDVHCRALITALSEDTGIPPERLMCGNGAAELIFAWAYALRPGKALLLAPCFAEYEAALTASGCTIERYRLSPENGFVLDEGFLDALSAVQPDAVVLCSPNNPTGVPIDLDLLEAIAARCEELGIRLMVDECFNEFLCKPERFSIRPLLLKYPHMLVLNAFTKIYAMPGIRLGFCSTADEALLARMRTMIQPWSVSVPAQLAGVAALKEKDYVEQTRAIVQRERLFLQSALTDLGFWVCNSEANYLLFRAEPDLAEKTKARGILIRDCSNYPGLEKGYFRIAVRTHDENLLLIETLEAITNGT